MQTPGQMAVAETAGLVAVQHPTHAVDRMTTRSGVHWQNARPIASVWPIVSASLTALVRKSAICAKIVSSTSVQVVIQIGSALPLQVAPHAAPHAAMAEHTISS